MEYCFSSIAMLIRVEPWPTHLPHKSYHIVVLLVLLLHDPLNISGSISCSLSPSTTSQWQTSPPPPHCSTFIIKRQETFFRSKLNSFPKRGTNHRSFEWQVVILTTTPRPRPAFCRVRLLIIFSILFCVCHKNSIMIILKHPSLHELWWK